MQAPIDTAPDDGLYTEVPGAAAAAVAEGELAATGAPLAGDIDDYNGDGCY